MTTASGIADQSIWEVMRGVIWNDDPEAMLFENNDNESANWSNGLVYGTSFKRFEQQAAKGTPFGPGASLLARSHFGDLQCLHAMATSVGLPATTTKKEVLDWAEFFYAVACGSVTDLVSVKVVASGVLARWFPLTDMTVRELLVVGRGGSSAERSLGALLHIVQDSYSAGHVQRDADGRVARFLCYVTQSHREHAKHDAMPRGGLYAIPWADAVIGACGALAQLVSKRRPWSHARTVLDQRVFALAPNSTNS